MWNETILPYEAKVEMILESLKKCELFAELTDSELEQVGKLVQHRTVLAGRPIIEEGAEAFSLFAIEHGSVDVIKNAEGGARPKITELFQGTVFGEIALMDHSLRSAEVVAHTDATIVELNYSDLEVLAKTAPAIGCKIYKALAQSLSKKTRNTTNSLVSHLISSRMTALGELTSSIAHEVKTPLTSIMLNVEMLEHLIGNTPVDQKLVQERCSVIRSTVVRAATIIDGLRGMMSETNSDPRVTVLTSAILEDALRIWNEKYGEKNIRVEMNGTELKGEMKCRAVQISQVVLNLLNNAAEAISTSADRWIKVEILDQGTFVCIAVTDSGSGIPHESREKLFQPFYTTKGVNAGTGLGLSISRAIAERHWGSLTLDTACKNTRFVLKIPKN